MSKYAAINTLDHRLIKMGFSHPDSTQKLKYINAKGDTLSLTSSISYGKGWHWYANGVFQYFSSYKKRVIAKMEESGRYDDVRKLNGDN